MDYIVEAIYPDGTIKARRLGGDVAYFGLAIKPSDDEEIPAQLYLTERLWNDKPEPPTNWKLYQIEMEMPRRV
jgi:hypothetical protein